LTTPDLIRSARSAAGLTQAELARRLGVSQAAVAKLERRGANPTVETLKRVMHATGHRLELRAIPEKSSVDDTLIASIMRSTPAKRLDQFESWYGDMRDMLAAAARDDAAAT
jgi:transcriptional regulator with XRE-family HTH domain